MNPGCQVFGRRVSGSRGRVDSRSFLRSVRFPGLLCQSISCLDGLRERGRIPTPGYEGSHTPGIVGGVESTAEPGRALEPGARAIETGREAAIENRGALQAQAEP